jgi:hypothetical protein
VGSIPIAGSTSLSWFAGQLSNLVAHAHAFNQADGSARTSDEESPAKRRALVNSAQSAA